MSPCSWISKTAGLAGIVLALGASVALAATQLTGAGSTFDYPFFSKAFYEYSQQHADVTVNYQSIGSGGGIQQFIAKTVDFGASDVPMNAEELKLAKAPVLQVPVTLGAAAIGYNIPGIGKGLRMTRQLIAEIYLGNVKKWNAPEIAKLNPKLKLPDMDITVVHRSDGSGTTYIFTDFLSHVSAQWKEKVGTGKSVQWPAGIGGKGNEGVAGQVRQTPGAIGYIELAYVLENQMSYARVENKAGKFEYPTIETVAAAAASKPEVSSTDFSIVDAAGENSYPISGYSWVMLYQHPSDPARGKLVRETMEWLVTKGQAVAKSVDYVPLPENVQQRAIKLVSAMKT
ncbi:MAG TPA: phosphate ABC transporter substrate-binding protein PstS [Candidatus Binataceae bacterium]|nr:phosphate ABC transporter substrate-binding protein PstS [Candidatus Binataceae bacterium]